MIWKKVCDIIREYSLFSVVFINNITRCFLQTFWFLTDLIKDVISNNTKSTDLHTREKQMDFIVRDKDITEYENMIPQARRDQFETAFDKLAGFIEDSFAEAQMHSSWKIYYVPGEWYDKKVKRKHIRIKLRVNITMCADDELLPIECIPHNYCNESDYVFDLKNVTKAEKYAFMKMFVTFCNENELHFYNSVLKRKYWTTAILSNPTVESIIETEKRELFLASNYSIYKVRPTMIRDDYIRAKLIKFI